MKDQILSAFDVSSRKIAGAVARLSRDKTLQIVGVTEIPTHGIRRQVITNIEEVSHSISSCADRLSQITGLKLTHAVFSISGKHIQSFNHSGAIAITPSDRDITMDDVNRVIDIAGAMTLDSDRNILALAPRTYTIDGMSGIKNPIGMAGHKLEVEAHIITGLSAAQRNLVKCANSARISVDELVVSGLASSEAALSPGERDMGVTLIDIGAGSSDVVVFSDGGPIQTFALEEAGDLITDDIAYGLRLPSSIAEQLKITFGAAGGEHISRAEMIDLSQFLPDCREVVSRYDLAEKIILPRIEEILLHIRDEIYGQGIEQCFAGGIVLTGGTSKLAGITELAAKIFNAPARVGAPHSVYGMTDAFTNPSYATVIGLLRWQEQILAAEPAQSGGNFLQAAMQRIKFMFGLL